MAANPLRRSFPLPRLRFIADSLPPFSNQEGKWIKKGEAIALPYRHNIHFNIS